MATTQRRFVFKEPGTAEIALLDHQTAMGWTFDAAIPADADQGIPYELVFLTPDGSVSIHYVDDRLVKFPYVVVKGEAADVERVAARMREKVKLYSDEEIRAYAARADSRAQKMESLAFAAVSAPPEHDERYASILRAGLSDPDPQVRRTAVWMAGYPSWPELVPLLRERLESDPDDDVRESAGYVLAGFEHEGIG